MTEVADTPKQLPASPVPLDDLSTGSRILVLYWCPVHMPDNTDSGRWETVYGVVISIGELICVELGINTLPGEWVGAFPSPEGSFLRFVDPRKCFLDHQEAVRHAQENPGLQK